MDFFQVWVWSRFLVPAVGVNYRCLCVRKHTDEKKKKKKQQAGLWWSVPSFWRALFLVLCLRRSLSRATDPPRVRSAARARPHGKLTAGVVAKKATVLSSHLFKKSFFPLVWFFWIICDWVVSDFFRKQCAKKHTCGDRGVAGALIFFSPCACLGLGWSNLRRCDRHAKEKFNTNHTKKNKKTCAKRKPKGGTAMPPSRPTPKSVLRRPSNRVVSLLSLPVPPVAQKSRAANL